MTLSEHRKHTELRRPVQGYFGRTEWAILGTPCASVKQLAAEIISGLSGHLKCVYVDAAHARENEPASLPGRLAAGAFAEYTDKISHHEFSFNRPFNAFQYRNFFSEADVVLVNGNHQEAKSQVVVIDQVKEASLRKNLHRLTDVQLFLLGEGENDIFDFLKEAINGWERIPVIHTSDRQKILSFFQEKLLNAVPRLFGLVLAGGRSIRLGVDKGMINWHGKEQRYFLAELLATYCDEVFISCREDQQAEIDSAFQALPDTFTGLGPYGAILSAFREHPDVAWLVIACDLPLINETTIEFLISHRNYSSIGTTFRSPFDGLPEPLITIWEPKSYAALLRFLSQGYSCPRKALLNNDSTILSAPWPDALMNVNTPEELKKAKSLLETKMSSPS